jgi:hypothetical protein
MYRLNNDRLTKQIYLEEIVEQNEKQTLILGIAQQLRLFSSHVPACIKE